MRSPESLLTDRRLVDTACMSAAKCPRCDAATSAGPGSEYAVCVSCLFDLILDEAEPAPPARSEAMDPVRSVCGRLGNYELIEEIGRGGMGVIYKALAGNGDIVAVKALLPGLGDGIEARERFEREARAIASLRHPFIVPIYEVCLQGATPFFSMELAPAGSLADLMPKYHSHWRQAAQLVIQVAGAVHHAHLNGVIHRDLKPGNILFTRDLDPLVSDFGLAKWLDDSGADLTQSLVMFGTPNYVSPEQASGKNRELTPATDVYSLGAILFEMLAGRPPFVGDNPLQVLQQVLAGCAPPLRSVAPALPAGLEAICARCLDRDSRARYASAADLGDDIERWLNGDQVVLRRPLRGALPALLGKKRLLKAGAVSALAVTAASVAYFALRPVNLERRADETLASTSAITVEVDNLSPDGELDSFSNRLSEALNTMSGDAKVRVLPVRRLTTEFEEPMGDDGLFIHTPSDWQVAVRVSVRRVDSRTRVVSIVFERGVAHPLSARLDWLPFDASNDDFRDLWQTLHKQLTAEFANPRHNPQRSGPAETSAASLCEKAAEFFHRVTRVDNDRAIGLYQGALREQPNNVSAHSGLADAYRMRFDWWGGDPHDLERARQNAKDALTAEPFSAKAHHALGCCLVAEKHFTEAREELLQELEIEPESPGGNVYVGICCRQLGQLRQALTWVRRAARLDPIHGVFNMAVGEVYMLTGDDQKANTELRRACEIDPERPDAHNSLAVLALWQGRKAEAKEICRDLASRFPANPYKEQLTAEVAFFCGDSTEALARYLQLAAADTYSAGFEFFGAVSPDSAAACLLQKEGKIGEASRRLTSARATDEQLLLRFPNNSRLLHDLAAIYALEGEHELALKYLSEALGAGWVERRSTMIDPRFESLRGDRRFTESLSQALQ